MRRDCAYQQVDTRGAEPVRDLYTDFLRGAGNELPETRPHHHRVGEVHQMDRQRFFLTPDGHSYVYGYGRAATSDLYVIDGLK